VDYASQQRTLKDSALWYQRFLGQTGASPATAQALSEAGAAQAFEPHPSLTLAGA
jgi:hypothetical protein